jgi:hypothetical protein
VHSLQKLVFFILVDLRVEYRSKLLSQVLQLVCLALPFASLDCWLSYFFTLLFFVVYLFNKVLISLPTDVFGLQIHCFWLLFFMWWSFALFVIMNFAFCWLLMFFLAESFIDFAIFLWNLWVYGLFSEFHSRFSSISAIVNLFFRSLPLTHFVPALFICSFDYSIPEVSRSITETLSFPF